MEDELKQRITLGEKEYKFEYSMASFKAMSKKYKTPFGAFEKLKGLGDGKDRMASVKAFFQPEVIEAITFLTWAGLMTHDEKIKVEDLDKLITMENILEIIMVIGKAFGIAMPDAKGSGGGENPQEA